jgi:hypothetical protein
LQRQLQVINVASHSLAIDKYIIKKYEHKLSQKMEQISDSLRLEKLLVRLLVQMALPRTQNGQNRS